MMAREQIWIKMERDRQRVLPKARRIYAEALQKAFRPVLDNIGEQSHADQALQASPELLDQDRIEEGFEQMYEEIMPVFIRRRFNDLTKSHKDRETQWLRAAREYIRSGEIADRIVRVTDTSKDRVRTIIQRGIDEGMDVRQIARNIDELGFEQLIQNRSTVVARTEVINASNRGDIIGARETNLDLKKEWLTSIDGRERDGTDSPFDHASADGQQVDLEDSFIVSGESLDYPGDPRGSAGNVIQCRCTQTYVEQ